MTLYVQRGHTAYNDLPRNVYIACTGYHLILALKCTYERRSYNPFMSYERLRHACALGQLKAK